MIPSIDFQSSVAVYVQIENQVQFAIASGKIKPGDRLPTVRELSEKLKVNPNTVAKAYRDLQVMGLIYTRRGKGVFIDKNIAQRTVDDCMKRIVGRLFEVVAEAKAAGLTKKEIAAIVDASIGLDAAPYGEVPAALMVLAKKKIK